MTRTIRNRWVTWLRWLPLVVLTSSGVQLAAGGGPWQGKACAVVLTYDDGLRVHLENVVPLLDSLGFKGTFYVPGGAECLRDSTSAWRAVAASGHELGNHTLFHPCDSRPSGRGWVHEEYDLRTYTVRRMEDEIQVANLLLRTIDGRTERTFAFTCGDRMAGDSSIVDAVRRRFPGARGTRWMLQKQEEIDLYDIGAFMVSEHSGEDLIRLVREAIDRQALLVFLFHGVGGGHSINVSLNAHRQLLTFLKNHEAAIHVAPMLEVVKYLRALRHKPWPSPDDEAATGVQGR